MPPLPPSSALEVQIGVMSDSDHVEALLAPCVATLIAPSPAVCVELQGRELNIIQDLAALVQVADGCRAQQSVASDVSCR